MDQGGVSGDEQSGAASQQVGQGLRGGGVGGGYFYVVMLFPKLQKLLFPRMFEAGLFLAEENCSQLQLCHLSCLMTACSCDDSLQLSSYHVKIYFGAKSSTRINVGYCRRSKRRNIVSFMGLSRLTYTRLARRLDW